MSCGCLSILFSDGRAVNVCLLEINELLPQVFDDIDIDKDEQRMSQAAISQVRRLLETRHIHDVLLKVISQVIAWIMTILEKESSFFLKNRLMVPVVCLPKNKFILTGYISRMIDCDWLILFSPADINKIDLYVTVCSFDRD